MADFTDERAAIAPLPTLDFGRLEKRDADEIQLLVNACDTNGFFYLDFRGSELGRRIMTLKEEVLQFSRNYFAQPFDVKMKDYRNVKHRGFLPVGTFTAVEKGSRASYEHLSLSRDEFFDSAPELPNAVREASQLFDEYFRMNTYATNEMFACLSDALGLEDDARFERKHHLDRPSDTALGLLSYPPDGPTLHKHTDIGTLTILFASQWGLQVVAPGTGDWEFVQPRPDHAIINVGDMLRFMSGKRFNSCLHRVVRATGKYETDHRYSVAFLLRSDSDSTFEAVDGQAVSAKEWHDKKYDIYSATHEVQDADQTGTMTGGMEKLLSRSVAVA